VGDGNDIGYLVYMNMICSTVAVVRCSVFYAEDIQECAVCSSYNNNYCGVSAAEAIMTRLLSDCISSL